MGEYEMYIRSKIHGIGVRLGLECDGGKGDSAQFMVLSFSVRYSS